MTLYCYICRDKIETYRKIHKPYEPEEDYID